MKILITGADGLLGSNLVRKLLKLGHDVSVLIYGNSTSSTLQGLDIRVFKGNILEPDTLIPAMKGKDAVIHAAANTSVWPSKNPAARAVNIDGTRNMIDAVLNNNISRMVFVGSGATVTPEGELLSREEYYKSPSKLDYISSKFEAQHLIQEAYNERNLPVISILPTFMLGPYDSLPSSGKMIKAIAQGKLKFYSGGGKNFVYVNDVADAIVNALVSPHIGKYYVARGENLTYKEFITKVSELIGAPLPKMRMHDWTVNTVGVMGSLIGTVSGKAPIISLPMAKLSTINAFSYSDHIYRDLNMPKTPVEKAILECYNWFNENGYLN